MNKEAVQHERGPRNSTLKRQLAMLSGLGSQNSHNNFHQTSMNVLTGSGDALNNCQLFTCSNDGSATSDGVGTFDAVDDEDDVLESDSERDTILTGDSVEKTLHNNNTTNQKIDFPFTAAASVLFGARVPSLFASSKMTQTFKTIFSQHQANFALSQQQQKQQQNCILPNNPFLFFNQLSNTGNVLFGTQSFNNSSALFGNALNNFVSFFLFFAN